MTEAENEFSGEHGEEKELVSGRLTCYDTNDRPEDFVPTTRAQEKKAVVKVLYTQEEILRRAKELALAIYDNYKDKDQKPLFISLEHGARPFADALIEAYMQLDSTFDPSKDVRKAKVHSYKWTESGSLTFDYKPEQAQVEWREVILVDDIVDTAKTLGKYTQILLSQWATKVDCCALLHKTAMSPNFKITYKWFSIENKFVIWFGLDCDGKYRDLPNICVYNTDLELEKQKQNPSWFATDSLLETLEK